MFKELFEKVTHKEERKELNEIFIKEMTNKENELRKANNLIGKNTIYMEIIKHMEKEETKTKLGLTSKFANKYYDKLNKRFAKSIYNEKYEDLDFNHNDKVVKVIDEKYNFTLKKKIYYTLFLIFAILPDIMMISSSGLAGYLTLRTIDLILWIFIDIECLVEASFNLFKLTH